jgi:crotonobetainyl-CoA:carnitine CoA-transferase CaiB-like acyl-CoA transferase
VKKRVYDPIIQGLSGFADIQSQPVTNRPQMIRTIVCDKTTAVFIAQAVSSALYAREKTGKGDHIQVAMLDAMISYLWPEGMMRSTVVGGEAASADPNDRPDLVFKTSHGYITAGTISDSEWQGFCKASGEGVARIGLRRRRDRQDDQRTRRPCGGLSGLSQTLCRATGAGLQTLCCTTIGASGTFAPVASR